MAKEGLLDPNVKSIFVTCGDWDLSHAPRTGPVLALASSDYFKQWVNLKKAYSFAMGCWPKNGLLDMNKGLSLQHIGRPHSGIGQSLHISPWQLGQSPVHTPQCLAHRGVLGLIQCSSRVLSVAGGSGEGGVE